MKISDLIEQLQATKDEHGDLIVTYPAPGIGVYEFDKHDMHVCIDESELVYANGGVSPLREFLIEKAVVFGRR